ncbi:NgoMIV family type II restriction endonuclease [Gordonia tangerina]|uniref:NgoMIV family type II restriction endonuclease n=1 Tax=Gordonia tangerina TaxID=2911060 RepID=A0ABS9DD73_9ACTN|nr:NgoMIV family type II restriction endonuclease [Gordonia tangerina]MCF3937175.1 NgoMIV family type II restriction endonuclease [Gordonia tangerina]
MISLISGERRSFYQRLVRDHTLSVSGGVASNADASQRTSRAIALNIAERLGAGTAERKLDGQRAGKQFEGAVAGFIGATFPHLGTLRPGTWEVMNVGGSRGTYQIAKYEPYTHLDDLANAIDADPTLQSVLGNSYDISPDVLVLRHPESDDEINAHDYLVDDGSARHAVIRASNQPRPIVHAIVSCKWTLRSDRAQNARSEALNIIRNRKGRTPHIAVVTAEPTPSRLASLALGTGDVDTVYHFALPELVDAVHETENDEAISMLHILVDGKRLRDISDLPLDLAV